MAVCACGCGAVIAEGRTWKRGHHLKKPHYEVDVEELETWTEATGLDGLEEEPVMVQIPNLKVHIYPSFGDEDKGDGGIRRVVEGQLKHLPKFGIDIVETAAEADVIAYHATVPKTYINLYPDKTFVSMVHGFYWSEYEWDNWSLKANAEVMEGVRVADAVIGCSEWVANAIRRHTSRDVKVISHGIDAEDWQPDEDARDYVLWNKTRPDPVCDPGPMNEVAALLPNVKFISTFGQEAPNVALTGKLPFEAAKKLIQKAGVYLCTARETFGIGTLEAMACGVPIVGFNFGGQAEFVEHKSDGWLATPGDIQGLAEGIKWALANRRQIAIKAQAKAKKFTWEKACLEYSSVFFMAHDNRTRPRPRTSIVVTNYNLHDYLEDCLRSVAEQSDENWECIIVDDASTDPRGREIAKDFMHDDRFKLVENDKNVYLSEARNVGIRVADGRYILPLDADDMLAPDAVAVLADALDSDKSIHVAYGNVRFVDEDGMTPTDYGSRKFPPGYSPWPFPFEYEQQIAQMNLLPYASMYRKEAWEQVGGYRRRHRTAEDADLWTRLSSYGFRPKLVTDVDTLVYRNRQGSMSREQGEVDWTSWYSWTRVYDFTPAGALTRDQLPINSNDPIIVSVVIPVGPGHERYIHDAVDSVDAQYFRNWECIVVNDTGGELPELPAWVRVLSTEGRTGPAHARNVGIRASKGRLFLPLDADDYLEPNALQFMYIAYQETKDIIYSDFYQTDPTGKNISIHECDDYDAKLLTGGKRRVGDQNREGMIHSVTALTPKSVWEKVGGYDESLPAWEDWDFQLAAGAIGACSRRVAYPLFMYRKHTGLRREENYEFFERSKEGILRKWGDLWTGGKELMACRSCGMRTSYAPNTSGASNGAWQQPMSQNISTNQDAVLIKYTGNKQGSFPVRGPSKTMYWFAAGDEKYVLQQDSAFFLNTMQNFEAVQFIAEPVSLSPVLVADGPPVA